MKLTLILISVPGHELKFEQLMELQCVLANVNTSHSKKWEEEGK
jgi:hypothetical protein